jgi:transcriptional regulator with XRE-family HTH domain
MRTRSHSHAAFGNAIREIRKRHGISQTALAEECRLDRTYISGIERGQRNPSLTNILKIAAALSTRPSDLFARAEELQDTEQQPSKHPNAGPPRTAVPIVSCARNEPHGSRCSYVKLFSLFAYIVVNR